LIAGLGVDGQAAAVIQASEIDALLSRHAIAPDNAATTR
jgi:hypothetical protein